LGERGFVFKSLVTRETLLAHRRIRKLLRDLYVDSEVKEIVVLSVQSKEKSRERG